MQSAWFGHDVNGAGHSVEMQSPSDTTPASTGKRPLLSVRPSFTERAHEACANIEADAAKTTSAMRKSEGDCMEEAAPARGCKSRAVARARVSRGRRPCEKGL